ncbi:integrase core domain protein [Rhizoctonia solani]|uniref:Integrase core domain protein n=1 Tax=Rhizoctonia solani TaxID=456999 RepID=A0A8H8P324_9AGAM|nr:integrase core domain protein [Rhizoctonia solani]QRW23748.1 integrase core domain protein [Rhizoctonia solani]
MAEAVASTSAPGAASGTHRIAPLRGTENYNMWRIQMEDILSDLDLYGYVNKTIIAPSKTVLKTERNRKDDEGKPLPDYEYTATNDEYTKWVKADRKALSNIRLRVDGSVLNLIQGCTTSADAWNALATTYQVKGTVGLIDLQRKFFSHRMTDGEDIEEHIQRMRGWFQRINNISPGSCTEADWITTLIASLPDSWDSFSQSVSFQFDLQDNSALSNQVNDIRSRTTAEAHRKNARNPEGKAFFSTNKASFNKPIRTGSKGPDKSKSKCNNCGKIGHWAAKCRGPGGGAYKPGQNNGKGTNRKFNAPNKARNGNARTHIAVEDNNSRADYAFSTLENSNIYGSKPTNTWIADSGTTTHIANNRSLFSEYNRSTGYVTGVTGKEPILGRGTVELLCLADPDKDEYRSIKLTNVAYVPSSPANLISLSLVTDKGYRISMDWDQLVIYSANNDPITYGSKLSDRKHGNLWKISGTAVSKETARMKKTTNELALMKQTGRTWFEWHKTLGHISPQALQRLKSTEAIKGMEINEDKEGLNFECEVCIQAKAHTRPYPNESATKISDIADTDTMHKDETLNEYKAFEAMLNTQKEKKIKKVRFDNGGEFVNKEWIEYAAQKGTILETKAPHSSQQNGIAERLNWTLTNKARAMMLESNAPKFLWNEAIAYACYLKN